MASLKLLGKEEINAWDAFVFAGRKCGYGYDECIEEADRFIIARRRRILPGSMIPQTRYDGFGNCLSCGVHDCDNEICGPK